MLRQAPRARHDGRLSISVIYYIYTLFCFIVEAIRLCYNIATMNNLNLSGVKPSVAVKIVPLVEELLREQGSNVHSFHIVGSAVIPDYNEKLSDINSVAILHNMDLKFISFLAPLGRKYGKKRIAAPLVMTPEYIRRSLDVFPIEFLDFRLVHQTIYGIDILRDLQIDKSHLRLQCEREIKTKLINVRQGYISSLGKREHLDSLLVKSITGSMAFFRAIITLLGKEPPIPRADVISAFGAAAGIETGIFSELLALKAKSIKPSERELHSLFERYYIALESTEKIIDGLHI